MPTQSLAAVLVETVAWLLLAPLYVMTMSMVLHVWRYSLESLTVFLFVVSALLPPLGLLCLVGLSFSRPEATAARRWVMGLMIVVPVVVTGAISCFWYYLLVSCVG